MEEQYDPSPSFGRKIKNALNNIGRWIGTHKVASVLILAGLVLICVGVVAYGRYFSGPEAQGLPGLNQDKKSSERKVINNLDGTSVSVDLANRRPVAVMIENHPDARPQSGFDKASLVYEAVAEGGITRFMGVYGPYEASEIGPVRSARTYFMEWALEWDAMYAHAGGTQDALSKINAYGIDDLPHAANYFIRKNKPVASEHTLYTSTKSLYDYAKSRKYSLSADFEKRPFKKDVAESARPATQEVKVNFSDPLYGVTWTYDKATNSYLRSMAGSPHKDAVSGQQLSAKNIVVLTNNMRAGDPVVNSGKSWNIMPTEGEGKVVVLQDGKAISGKWKKANRTARTRFYTESGSEIEFNPGLTWFQTINPGQGSITGI